MVTVDQPIFNELIGFGSFNFIEQIGCKVSMNLMYKMLLPLSFL
jgi:hypothetical protein